MRKTMERLASKLDPQVMQLTENPLNLGRYEGYRYFLVWLATREPYKAFKTQAECVEELREIVENGGYVSCGGTLIKVTK